MAKSNKSGANEWELHYYKCSNLIDVTFNKILQILLTHY
jgi:hypothetical protein